MDFQSRSRPHPRVMVRKSGQRIECKIVLVEFIARGDFDKMPVTELNTLCGVLRYSTPEVMAFELVCYAMLGLGAPMVAAQYSGKKRSFCSSSSLDGLPCKTSPSGQFGYSLSIRCKLLRLPPALDLTSTG